MNPSLDAIIWIRAFADTLPGGIVGNSAADIVEAANAPTVPNPREQAVLPKPFGISDLMAKLDAAAIGKLRTLPSLPRLIDDINSNNRAGISLWVSLLEMSGDITEPQAASILSVVNATEPDPGWKPTVGRAEASIGRPIDLDDVFQARDL